MGGPWDLPRGQFHFFNDLFLVAPHRSYKKSFKKMLFQMSKNSRLVAAIWCPYLVRPHKGNDAEISEAITKTINNLDNEI